MNFIFDFSKDVGQQLGQHLCKLDPFQFQRMNMIYKRKPVRQFGEVLESRTSSQLHNILVAMYNYSINKLMYFATFIHDELHKELIDVLDVQRFLLFRSEIDLHTIDKAYKA
uniref:Smp_205300 n=2 Tax=Schistosoma mansoni TaxID=6183 RepID=A0A3Q0KV93_SCHMA